MDENLQYDVNVVINDLTDQLRQLMLNNTLLRAMLKASQDKVVQLQTQEQES